MFQISNRLNRFLYTLFVLFIYKVLSSIPLPLINHQMLDGSFEHKGILASMNIMTGTLQKLSILALGLTPPVIVQILLKIFKNSDPAFKAYDKDPLQRRQINRISRWLTIVTALVLGGQMIFTAFPNYPNLFITFGFWTSFWCKVLMVFYLAVGAIITMRLTELINEYGISGAGFSALLLTSVLSSGISSLWHYFQSIDVAQNYVHLAGVFVALLTFSVFILALFYIVIFNRRKILYLLIFPLTSLAFVVYIQIRDFILVHLNRSMTVLLVVSCIFVFFKLLILYGEEAIYENKICLIKQKYDTNSSLDIFPTKINLGGITPVIVAENSIAFLRGILNLLLYTGIFSFLNFELSPVVNSIFEISWKSGVMFVASFLWALIEIDPHDTADNLKSRGIFPGVAEGKYTEMFNEHFIRILSFRGVLYLLIVVTVPNIINTICYQQKIITGHIFSGTAIILLVSSAIDIFSRLMSAPPSNDRILIDF